jgi:hypothetical protein
MHPALFKLFWLRNKAAFRRTIRGARTLRGAVLLLVGLGVLALYPGMTLFTLFMMRRPEAAPVTAHFAGAAEPYLPLILLGLCLMHLLRSPSTPFLFSPPEVEFLFPGPFHRRELLLFKLMGAGQGLVLFSLFFASSPMLLYLKTWLGAFVGVALAMAMVRMVGIATALLGQIVAAAAYTKARKAILMVLMVLLATGLPQAFVRARALSAAGLAQSFRLTWPGRVLLAPFEVFSHVIFAERWFPDLVGWGAVGAAIDLGLLILILRLDADYLERAAAISQWIYELQQRARRSGGFAAAPIGRGTRYRLPQLPWLGGAGPIAWRQLLSIVRTSSSLIIYGFIAIVMLLLWSAYQSRRFGLTAHLPWAGIGVLAYASLGLTMAPWAFCGDLDHLDFLKTLPVRPLALAVGELAGGVLVLVAFQLLVLAVLAAAAPAHAPLPLAAAAFAAPVDTLLLATNNLIFLIYPVRLTSSTGPDFARLGRAILAFLMRVFILVPGLGIPAGLGGIAYLLTNSWTAFGLTAWLILVGELLPAVLLVAWAFRRFDPSTDVLG